MWESTLLVITYDEHGGLYDHVTPPATVNPDGKIAKDTGENVAPDIPPFDFTRLGIRVPAVIVSPFIERCTIDPTAYDHTSIIATARKLFLGAAGKELLTERDRTANTFDRVLNRTTPRADTPNLSAPQSLETLALMKTNSLNKPLSVHQQALVEQAYQVEQSLPANRRSGKTPADIKTERDASRYLAQVTAELTGSG